MNSRWSHSCGTRLLCNYQRNVSNRRQDGVRDPKIHYGLKSQRILSPGGQGQCLSGYLSRYISGWWGWVSSRDSHSKSRLGRIILQHLAMAVHAGGCRRDIWEPGFFNTRMAIAAIHAQLTGVNRVRERHWLNRLITDARILRCEIIRDAQRHGSPY